MLHTSVAKGKLEVVIPHFISLDMETATLPSNAPTKLKQPNKHTGPTRALLITPLLVSVKGLQKLELVGIGYRAVWQGKRKLEVGYSHDTRVEPEGSSILP